MAQYHASFTQAKLAQIYSREAETGDDARLLASFGRPLARTTQEAYGLADRAGNYGVPHSFLSPAGLLTYNELGRSPHYVDERGRQYFAYGVAAPTQAYCRIPKGLTAAQNRGEIDHLDLPYANETVTLSRGPAWGRAGSEARNAAPIELTVLQRLDQTKAGAVCLLIMSDALVAPEGLDVVPEHEEDDYEKEQNSSVPLVLKKRLEHITARIERRAEQLRQQGVTLPDNQDPDRPAGAGHYQRSGHRPHLKTPSLSHHNRSLRMGKLRMSKRR